MSFLHYTFSRTGFLAAPLLASAIFAGLPLGAQSPAETRDLYKEYIEIKKIIGEERAQWREEKAALTDMISVLETEQTELEEVIARYEDSATTADRQRAELREQVEEARDVSTRYNETIASFEARTESLLPTLPSPLRADVQPLTGRLPEDPSNTRLSYSQRLQTVVGIIAQADKFNAELSRENEVKSLDTGNFEVETLYLGLGAALFSDTEGNYAGYGFPTPEGWTFTTIDAGEATSVKKALDTFAARAAPTFVTVPLKID